MILMDDQTREKIAGQQIGTFSSLNCAIYDAGGTPLSYEKTKKITLFEFICHVAAPNGIRFTHIKKMSKNG